MQARLALAQEEQEIQARRARLEEEAAAQRAKQLAKEEEERRRRQEVADLLKQLEAIGVTEAHGIEPGEDAKEAITRLLREKAEAEARRQKELKRSIDERLRRLDYYTRATRAVEATKATQLEEKLTESVTSFVAAERERVERFASTRHARNVLLQQEFHKAKTAWPSIERWVEERNAVAWAETMVSDTVVPSLARMFRRQPASSRPSLGIPQRGRPQWAQSKCWHELQLVVAGALATRLAPVRLLEPKYRHPYSPLLLPSVLSQRYRWPAPLVLMPFFAGCRVPCWRRLAAPRRPWTPRRGRWTSARRRSARSVRSARAWRSRPRPFARRTLLVIAASSPARVARAAGAARTDRALSLTARVPALPLPTLKATGAAQPAPPLPA